MDDHMLTAVIIFLVGHILNIVEPKVTSCSTRPFPSPLQPTRFMFCFSSVYGHWKKFQLCLLMPNSKQFTCSGYPEGWTDSVIAATRTVLTGECKKKQWIRWRQRTPGFLWHKFSISSHFIARSLDQKSKKRWNASRFCVSSLRRGHANLLCIVPILINVTSDEGQHTNGTDPVYEGELSMWMHLDRQIF